MCRVYMNTFQYFLVISALALPMNTSCVLCNFCIVKIFTAEYIQIVHMYVVYMYGTGTLDTVVLRILK